MNTLSEQIADALREYSAEVDAALQEESEKMAKEVVADLKSDPVIPVKTGEYKSGFYVKRVARGTGFIRLIVANKKYQLTHLLERGHVVRGGTGRSRAFPHWDRAQKKVDLLNERIKGALQ